MQCYTELIPPSAITHAVSLPFLTSRTKNLVVAKTSLLQIFDLKDVYQSDNSSNGTPEPSTKSKLVLIGEYPLSGTVTSLAAVKTLNTKSGGDALLIAFKDAKLSLVEWDPENYNISTISIHYYEGENIASQPFGPSLAESENILTVDPSSRCAALKFGARQLAIVPFRQLGDDLMDGADDTELDIAPPSATIKRTQSGLNEAAEDDAKQTPYKASFVLPLTALDPSLTHPVDLTFLHEYREPTFGILSSTMQASAALIDARKDILSYTVFTLDLEQRASTNLVSVPKLPSGLWKVVPLPLPVGGALLVGNNELVHVDQSGKTNAVAVNECAKAASGFGMADQAALNLKLEGCEIESLDPKTGDLLIVLNDGSLAILSFRLLGRNVGGLNVTMVAADKGGAVAESAPSCTASLNGNKVFVGSEDGNSSLLEWVKPSAALSRKRSHAQMLGQEPAAEESGDEDLDEDDLYATTNDSLKRTTSMSGSIGGDAAMAYRFELLDTLSSLATINNICFGRGPSTSKSQLELLVGIGRGKASRLAAMSKDIEPAIINSGSFGNARNAWSLNVRQEDVQESNLNGLTEYHNMLFSYDGESTKVYDIVGAAALSIEGQNFNPSKYSERTGTEFEHEGETLAVSTLANGTRVAQCRRNEIRTYDAADLSLSQIIPMIDEGTDEELKIVHTSFCDPYLLVIRDDNSIQVLQVDKSGDAEPLEGEGMINERKWLSGCLYTGEMCEGETVLILLDQDGGLQLFTLPDLKNFFSAPALCNLPPVLSSDTPQRRIGAKETLTEILFADLGTTHTKKPFLIVRTAMDDLTLYEPWSNSNGSWKDDLRFRKVPLAYVPKFDETAAEEGDGRPPSLEPLNIGGYAAVRVPGATPILILKEPTSLPKILGVQAKHVSALFPLHHRGCESGFGLLENGGDLKECQLPADCEFRSGWCIRRMHISDPPQEVRHIAFHEERRMYVVATCRDVDFYLPGDEWRRHEQDGMFSSQSLTKALFPFSKGYVLNSLRITSIYVSFSSSMERRL